MCVRENINIEFKPNNKENNMRWLRQKIDGSREERMEKRSEFTKQAAAATTQRRAAKNEAKKVLATLQS